MTDFTKYQERGAYHYKLYEDGVDWYVKCVDEVLDFVKGSTLDLGCGEGFIGAKLLEKGIEDYVGYDSDPMAIALADPELDVRQTDIEESASWQLDFEYLVCLNTIEHLQNPKVIPFIFKHCISKAAIIITDEAQPTLGKFHVHEFTITELLLLFKGYKTETLKIESKQGNFIGVKVWK